MNIAAQQGKAFSAAQLSIKTLVMKAGGWNVRQANEEALVHPSIFFYVMDYQTEWVWMCSVPKPSFYQAIAAQPKHVGEQAVYGVAQIITMAARGVAEAGWEERLAKLLSAYIAMTRTFEFAEQGHRAPHFLVVHYGNADVLRPAALIGPDRHVLPAQPILRGFGDIVSHDLQRNPQWGHSTP